MMMLPPKTYNFQEYPKWVTPPDGVAVIVGSQDEEAVAMGGGSVVQPVLDPEPVREIFQPKPAYNHMEFPKWANGVIVNSPDEERASYSPVSTAEARQEFLRLRDEEAKAFAARLFGPDGELKPDALDDEDTTRTDDGDMPADGLAPATDSEVASIVADADRDKLLTLAELGGVKIDKRWSTDRIRQAINGEP